MWLMYAKKWGISIHSLYAWVHRLQYDPETDKFSAAQIPAGSKPVEVQIQSIRNGQVLEESLLIVIDTK